MTAEISGNSEENEADFLFDGTPSKLSLYVVKNYMKDLVEFQNCTTDEVNIFYCNYSSHNVTK